MAIIPVVLEIPDPDHLLACIACDGAGTYYGEQTCEHCNGAGTVDGEDCFDCDGDGMFYGEDDCGECNGEGTKGRVHRNFEPLMNALVAAFTPLANDGWQIDMGTACCQGCAFSAADPDENRPFVGFHEQDTERVVESGDGLYLFHHLPNDEDNLTLMAALVSAGLDVDWDGSSSKRPYVTI